ncbi:S24 family peptidase [Rhizobium sp. CSW-27]|uniref:S24 family peptidase n=1 Tax=Rhizobium sp. CSW-27 TaxID=2839985 RepID=UPI001C010660|nr:S24 family peptidase [Rhizobium sp. CSW-27]MBT9373208.1 S24 family peptidase [Rhizobium sp. CSW-27]
MDPVRKIILKRIKERGLTYKVISEQLGKNPAYMQQFMERNVPLKLKEDVRARLSEILDISEKELGAPALAGHTGSRTNDMVPEISLVAGLGGGGVAATEVDHKNGITFARETIRDYWRLPDWMVKRMAANAGALACFPVQGDSMQPTICDGDVIFVDTRHRVPSPPGVYALADEFGGVIVKRLEVTSRPGDEIVRVRIASDNPRHLERELNLDEIHIVGRYVGRFTI